MIVRMQNGEELSFPVDKREFLHLKTQFQNLPQAKWLRLAAVMFIKQSTHVDNEVAEDLSQLFIRHDFTFIEQKGQEL